MVARDWGNRQEKGECGYKRRGPCDYRQNWYTVYGGRYTKPTHTIKFQQRNMRPDIDKNE